MNSMRRKMVQFMSLVNSASDMLGHFHRGPDQEVMHCMTLGDYITWTELGLDEGVSHLVRYIPDHEYGVSHFPPIVIRCVLDQGPDADILLAATDAAAKIGLFVFEKTNPHAYN